MNRSEKLSLLAEVASMYYEQNMTQSDIARKIFTSRSKVSRLIQQARDLGIVEIQIHYPGERIGQLEKELSEIYGIEVIVLNSRSKSYEDTLSGVGNIAAEYIDNIIMPGMTIGMSWGQSIYHTVRALERGREVKLNVVQIIGAAGTQNPVWDAPDLIREFAKAYGGTFKQINAPLYVEDDYVRNALLNDIGIKDTLNKAKNADLIITGIGSVGQQRVSSTWEGYFSEKDIDLFMNKGAVGYLSAHFFDKEGKSLDDVTNKRIIGLELEDIKKIPTVIGIACGEMKAEAIKGALMGKLVNVLITDDVAANKILESLRREAHV